MEMNRRTFLKAAAVITGSALTGKFSYGKESENIMIVEKKSFEVENFYFEEADRSIPVKIGYETYGELNDAKDNVIMICQYFTGTGHVSGKYREEDPAPGWWDAIVGPGKTIDTDRYFVISSDVLSNINFYNPCVITIINRTQSIPRYTSDRRTSFDNTRIKTVADSTGIIPADKSAHIISADYINIFNGQILDSPIFDKTKNTNIIVVWFIYCNITD